MEAILLPTDFSPTAKNAAIYAIGLAKQLGARRLVLYHSYEIPVSIDPFAPAIQMMDLDSLKASAAAGLEKFELSIRALADGLELSSINEYGMLPEGMDEVCAKANAGLIVMGITGGGLIEEKLIGSTCIAVAKHSRIPVLVVPAEAKFSNIRSVMLASDFDKADETIPVDLLQKIISETRAKLLVFHHEEGEEKHGVTHSSNVLTESKVVYSVLKDLDPEYHFSQAADFMESVNNFVNERNIDLVISIPKEHSFFERLFHTGHTKLLAFHSHVPVLLIHG